MLSLLKKTASVCLTLLGQRKFLFFLGVLCCMGMGYGQTVSITAPDPNADENGLDSGQFRVSVVGGLLTNVEVFLTIDAASTAISGLDYVALPISVNVPIIALVGSVEVDLSVLQDGLIEPDETVVWNIVPDASYTVGANPSATVTISSEDVANINIDSPTPIVEGNGPGDSTIDFTVNIDQSDPNNDITVNYLISGGNENGIGDVLTFPAGTTTLSQSVSVSTTGDTTLEPDENISVELSAPSANAVITNTLGTSSFVNDDAASVTIANVSTAEDVAGGNMVFTVTLDNDVALGTDVQYTFSDGTATGGGVDYTGVNNTLSFLGTAEVQNITVPIVNDAIVEGDETFTITLLTPTNGVTASGSPATGAIINDDTATVSIANTTNGSENNVGAVTNGVLTVTQSAVSATDTNVTYTISGGTATEGDDFTATGTVTIPAGDLSANFLLTVLEDTLVEGAETVEITLSGTSNPSITLDAVDSAINSITDDDVPDPCPTAPSAPPLDASEPTVFCDVINVDLNDYLTSTTAPSGTVLTWSVDSNPLETDAHLISSNVVDPGSYYGFFYDESNDCASPVLQITLVRNYTPVMDMEETVGSSRCGEGTVTLTALATVEDGNTITYNWFAVPTGGTSLGTGSSFETPPLTETTSYYVSASANGCVSERVEVVATINETPLAGVPLEDISVCNVTSDDGPNTLDLDDTLIGQDAGTWTVVTDPSDGTLVIGTGNVVDFTGLPSGNYVFEYTTNVAVAPCENTTAQVTVSVLDCVSNEAIDLAVTKQLKDEIAYLLGDPITFIITLENVEGKTVTDIVVSDLLDDAFQYEGHQATLGDYDPTTGEWTIDNMPATDATATLEITVISTTAGTFQNTATLVASLPNDGVASNNTATVSVQVNRSQCEDPGTICNIFSPNGDGVNDRLTLVDHASYPNNTFEVFDRYGNSVFQMDGYDSSWDGTGKNGDLPKGTYFYLLDLGDGSEVVKGWIQIVRKN